MNSLRRSQRLGIVLLATAIAMGVTAAMGFWQLSRAAQKQALEAAVAQQATRPALRNADLPRAGAIAAEFHRPVQLAGHWVSGANWYLDNRPMNGRSGFLLLTPLRLSGTEAVILVQRGWVPRNFLDRSKVPLIDTPAGEVSVVGRLAPPPSHLLELGESASGPIRQNIDISALSQETGIPLMPGVSVLQTGPDAPSLQRNWPRFAADVHKHHGYAAQWFAMSAVVGLCFVWFQIISPRRKRTAHGPDSR